MNYPVAGYRYGSKNPTYTHFVNKPFHMEKLFLLPALLSVFGHYA